MSEFTISVDLSVGSSESIADSLMSYFSQLDEEQVRKAMAQFFILFQLLFRCCCCCCWNYLFIFLVMAADLIYL